MRITFIRNKYKYKSGILSQSYKEFYIFLEKSYN